VVFLQVDNSFDAFLFACRNSCVTRSPARDANGYYRLYRIACWQKSSSVSRAIGSLSSQDCRRGRQAMNFWLLRSRREDRSKPTEEPA
jgi:hypothetical protein